jgi:hypothetical protein
MNKEPSLNEVSYYEKKQKEKKIGKISKSTLELKRNRR